MENGHRLIDFFSPSMSDICGCKAATCGLSPVVLGLQEVELLLDPVARLGDGELQRLSGLVGDLHPIQAACGVGGGGGEVGEGDGERAEPPEFSVRTRARTQSG